RVNVNQALKKGLRGLPGGDSLARLLSRARGVRNPCDLSPLTEGRVVAWAREHLRRTGVWPRPHSGPLPAIPGETWSRVDRPETGSARPAGGAIPSAHSSPGASAFPAWPTGHR